MSAHKSFRGSTLARRGTPPTLLRHTWMWPIVLLVISSVIFPVQAYDTRRAAHVYTRRSVANEIV
jgi:hypothetical protein